MECPADARRAPNQLFEADAPDASPHFNAAAAARGSRRSLGRTRVIQLTKLDVAQRQLRTAIELWFLDGDPVSIHTLVYAAHEIIHRLYRNGGGSDLLFDSSVVKEEYRGEFAKMLKEDANFFKHSERDMGATRSFNPAANELFLIMATTGIQRMGVAGDAESAFMFWLYLHNPQWFPEEVDKERIPLERLERMRSLDKATFFRAFSDAMDEKRRHGYELDGSKSHRSP